MFSKLMKSARAYIADKPEAETKKSPARTTISTKIVETSVVTPRRSTRVQAALAEEEELTDENSIHVYVPTSSVQKRKRAQEEEMSDNDVFVTPMSKKRKLPVRGKSVKSAKASKLAQDTHPVVEITSKPIASQELALVVEEGDDEEPEVAESKVPAITPSKPPSKHRRFASEEPAQVFSTPREQLSPVKNDPETSIVIDGSEDKEEESDDEAPEAIDTQQAAKTIQLKEREAAQAAKDQLSATRQKRKTRDENLKKQSENSKKRKVELEIAEEVPIANDEDVLESAEIAEAASEPAEEEESMTLDNLPTYQRKRHISDLQRNAIPELLPAEYLEDTEPTSVVYQESVTSSNTVSKKTKFRDLVGKQPKDKRVGSTTYRVSKARSSNLAPKSAYQARSIKEAWLQGRTATSGGANRKPFSSGFLRK